MLIQTDGTTWKETLANKDLPVFFEVDYLKAIRDSFNVTVDYFFYQEADEVVFASAVFVKRGRVIIPENFTYNPFWFKPGLNERRQLKIQKLFIEHLKSKYRNIALKFNMNVMDVRAFKWQGFDAEVRYTYLKDTGKPSHPDIEKNIKKADKSVLIIAGKMSEEIIDMNLGFLRRLGYNNQKRRAYKYLLLELEKLCYLKSFAVIKEDVLLAASIVLLDKKQKKAYTLISSPIVREIKYAHTLLYQERIDWLFKNGFKTVDFCGANMDSISNFKSFFNPELCPYYIVRYSAFKHRLNPFLNLLQRL